MPLPQVVAVAEHSPAERFGVWPGDELRSMNGQVPRDVIEYQLLADESIVELGVVRGGIELEVTVVKQAGEPLGLEISAAIFDRVRTCDNHCEFCFIYQLPKGMRRNLYVKDDDYRLSFLYGNFTTLTRFTEVDLERVLDQRLSPLYVSIHATDPDVRSAMLRNRRGAISLRWLRCLLDHGIEVHGQIVVCPGVNDAAVLHGTLAGILDRFPELVTVAVVPLGVSRYSKEPTMRSHTSRRGEGDRRDRARVAAALQPTRSGVGSCGHRTSTTCSRACRFLSPASTKVSRSTRTVSGWCGRSSRPSNPASLIRPMAWSPPRGPGSSPGSRVHPPRAIARRGQPR